MRSDLAVIDENEGMRGCGIPGLKIETRGTQVLWRGWLRLFS